MKYRLIVIADWIDAHILNHRFYRVCKAIGLSAWWKGGNMTYVLQNRRGKNFFRWLWLLMKLNKVLFHDIQKEIYNGEQVIHMLPHTYLIYKTIETKDARLQGARVISAGKGPTIIRQECKDYPVI